MKYRFMMIINWFRYLRELYEYHTWKKHLYKYQAKLKGAKLLGTDLKDE